MGKKRVGQPTICKYCGKTFAALKGQAGYVYCSQKCSDLFYKDQRRERMAELFKEQPKNTGPTHSFSTRTMPDLVTMAGDNPGAYKKAQVEDTMRRVWGKY